MNETHAQKLARARRLSREIAFHKQVARDAQAELDSIEWPDEIKAGDLVKHKHLGPGTVISVNKRAALPILVKFDSKAELRFHATELERQ